MSVDYDAPRVSPGDESASALTELAQHTSNRSEALMDVAETDLADGFDLPGAEPSAEELQLQIIPIQQDEFTCMSCFLVHHRSQLAREKDGKKYCRECES